MNWDSRTSDFPQDWYTEAFSIPGRDGGLFTEKTLQEVFYELDSDGKGYLVRSDIRRVLNLMGEAVLEDELDNMMLIFDIEGTGGVTSEQFVEGLLHPSPLFQNPSIVPGSVAALPSRRKIKQADDLQAELSRAADERRMLYQEVMADGRLKAGEIKKIFARFHEIDKDKKGVIQYSSFLVAMQREDTESSRRLFDLCDKDGSGEIDLKEFILGLSQFTDASKDDRVKFAFKLFDADNSGKIDREELTKIVRSTAPTSAQPQWITRRVDELYESVGLEPDSLIDLATFVELAKKNEHIIAPVIDELK